MAKKKKSKVKTKSKKIKKAVKKNVEKPAKKASKKMAPVKKLGMEKVYLGLGSNVGDREEFIEQAIFLLEKNPNIQVIKRSSNHETEAEGGADQPPFINAAIEIRSKLPPQKLLEFCQEIEVALGRERDLEWGPRPIDIDILLYGDQVISDDKLQIPHPLMHERLFVLKPLKEIAPHAFHPILEKDIETLFDERRAEVGGEKYDDELPGFREIKGAALDDYERW